MVEVPESHPRKKSLLSRQKIVDATKNGLLADSAMIAHGRGEAFDYLLGEKTSNSARLAIKESASRLIESDNPVISVNGNTAVLAGKSLIRVAAVLNCPIEVNIYYRTEERISKLNSFLEKQKKIVSQEKNPDNWIGDWNSAVKSVKILGKEGDGRIQGLEGPRSICSSQGIEKADVILVPLEDGDRCEALVNLGKQVLVVDLNPLSRTAKMATITIVDEISRAAELLLEYAINKEEKSAEWNNQGILNDALKIIAENSTG
ncbi:phosphopantothenate/pantothenate synthetase [Euryarchaeota archaeon]|nr:phosphopantothenate/pantothenate synthetase [Euryarchaeota archaeon]